VLIALITVILTLFTNTDGLVALSLNIFFEILLPSLHSVHRYCFFSFRIIKSNFFILSKKIARQFSNVIVFSIFLSSFLLFPSFPPILESILIIHSISRNSFEPHLYTISLIFALLIFPCEFHLECIEFNFLISLIVSSKLIIINNIIEISTYNTLVSAIASAAIDSPVMSYIIYSIFQYLLTISFQFKSMALVWTIISGAPISSQSSIGIIFYLELLRPNYFLGSSTNKHLFN
jgi:hypothetical protein